MKNLISPKTRDSIEAAAFGTLVGLVVWLPLHFGFVRPLQAEQNRAETEQRWDSLFQQNIQLQARFEDLKLRALKRHKQ